jgi:hypothetical protein
MFMFFHRLPVHGLRVKSSYALYLNEAVYRFIFDNNLIFNSD